MINLKKVVSGKMRLKLQLLIYFLLQKHFGSDCNTSGCYNILHVLNFRKIQERKMQFPKLSHYTITEIFVLKKCKKKISYKMVSLLKIFSSHLYKLKLIINS